MSTDTEQLEVRYQDIQEDDRIITVHGGGQFLVERTRPRFVDGMVAVIHYLTGERLPHSPHIRKDGTWIPADGHAYDKYTDDSVRVYLDSPTDKTHIIFDPRD